VGEQTQVGRAWLVRRILETRVAFRVPAPAQTVEGADAIEAEQWKQWRLHPSQAKRRWRSGPVDSGIGLPKGKAIRRIEKSLACRVFSKQLQGPVSARVLAPGGSVGRLGPVKRVAPGMKYPPCSFIYPPPPLINVKSSRFAGRGVKGLL